MHSRSETIGLRVEHCEWVRGGLADWRVLALEGRGPEAWNGSVAHTWWCGTGGSATVFARNRAVPQGGWMSTDVLPRFASLF